MAKKKEENKGKKSPYTKRLRKVREEQDRTKVWTLEEAVKYIKSNANAKFDETIELAINLGIDTKQSDQNVRGMVILPNGTGKTIRVAVFAKGPKAEEAKKEGRPVPVFDPAVPGISKARVEPPQDQQLRWQEALDKLPEDERAAEKAALVADWQAKSDLAARVKGMKEEEKREREASGKPSFGDFLGSLLGGGK